MNGGADRRHLQLDGVEPQLLYRASTANAGVADESDRLVAPFSVGVVERILQNRGRSAIILGSREDKSVGFADFLLPALERDMIAMRVTDATMSRNVIAPSRGITEAHL